MIFQWVVFTFLPFTWCILGHSLQNTSFGFVSQRFLMLECTGMFLWVLSAIHLSSVGNKVLIPWLSFPVWVLVFLDSSLFLKIYWYGFSIYSYCIFTESYGIKILMLQLWIFVYVLQKKITNKNFQVAISLMKTRSPNDYQCHAFTKSGTILYQIHCQCQTTGLLNYVPLIYSKLCVWHLWHCILLY